MAHCTRHVLLLLLLARVAGPEGAASSAAQQPTPAGKAVMRLSLKEAVETALAPEGNVRVRMAEEAVRQAAARSAQSRSALLPHLEASVTQQNLTRNLDAFGIRVRGPVPLIPPFVGPFNVFDARATATQTIFDFSSIRGYQASRAGVRQARAESEAAQDQVRGQVARFYLNAERADARLEAAKANVALAEALLKLAADQKEAGTGTGIEVTRARVQLADERQRLLVAGDQGTRAHLELLKAMGLSLDAEVELTEPLAYKAADAVTLEQAIRRAQELRADWKAQQQREESAGLQQSAARTERLPSLAAFADYGTIGSSIQNTVPTRLYGVTLRIPVFDGGRLEGRRGESAAQYSQERLRTRDLRQQMELEIRLAVDSLRSAEEQVKVAEDGLLLAEQELAQAQRRYKAGMAPGIEVTDAQTRLQRAKENRIDALFSHNLARIELALAMGNIRSIIQ